jgi:ABC-2 type transport system ATP-binding protein
LEAPAPIVVLEAVSKRFKDIYAVRNISITVRPGEVYGLLGPTGAGKSTLLKMVLGFLRPDEGTVSVFGAQDQADLPQARDKIGYLPEHPHFHPNFTGWEYLRFQARLGGLTRRNARASAERAVETVAAQAWIRRRIGYYTPEMLHRLGLAVALVGAGSGYPELLVLDEPSSHLERGGQMAVRDILLECRRRGSAILLASHRVTEVERVCDTVGVLKAGKLILRTEVENKARTIIVAVSRDGMEERLAALLKDLKRLHPLVTITGGQASSAPLIVSLPTGEANLNAQGIKASALKMLVDAGWDVISVYVERRDLESIYAQTLSPVAQAQTGLTITGPLITGPLGTPEQHGGAMTGPLDARFTRPLSSPAEGGAQSNGRETPE